MMKKLLPYFLCAFFVPVCFGALSDADEAADGYLTEGEYDGSDIMLEGFGSLADHLTIMGGGQIESQHEMTVALKCGTLLPP
ncbi:MAG: hypothetical protein ACYSO7_02985 [Planctomycetota bacterium]